MKNTDGSSIDTNHIRSLNISLNNIIKVPEGFGTHTKNLLILNISHNKLKSLTGLEGCRRLVFLNAKHNSISSVSTLTQLVKLKELFLGYNQISNASLKEFEGLRSLTLLDLRKNKLNDEDRFIGAL